MPGDGHGGRQLQSAVGEGREDAERGPLVCDVRGASVRLSARPSDRPTAHRGPGVSADRLVDGAGDQPAASSPAPPAGAAAPSDPYMDQTMPTTPKHFPRKSSTTQFHEFLESPNLPHFRNPLFRGTSIPLPKDQMNPHQGQC